MSGVLMPERLLAYLCILSPELPHPGRMRYPIPPVLSATSTEIGYQQLGLSIQVDRLSETGQLDTICSELGLDRLKCVGE